MKKFLFLFPALVFLPLQAHSQVAIIAPALEFIVEETRLGQVAHFAQMVEDGAAQIEHLKNQAETLANAFQRSILNLSRIGEAKSWDDFMDWYNRQLYLEKMTEETFNGMNVSIGDKNYSLWDVENIAYGVKDTYVDYWTDEFNEDQRKEMWLGLGLTPSNYAYVQTWKEKEKYLARKFLTSPAIQNNKYMQQMIRNNEFLRRLAGNAVLPEEEQLGEPELAAMEVEMAIANNVALNDLIMTVIDLLELKAVEMYQKQTPADQPVLSEWPDDVFKPLTD